ncbi:MAG: alpha/beta fold hydrolase [Planctomycetota bacterium]
MSAAPQYDPSPKPPPANPPVARPTAPGERGPWKRKPDVSKWIANGAYRVAKLRSSRLWGHAAREASRKQGGRRFAAHTHDGLKLDAWLSPAHPGAKKHQDNPKPPVVIAHGWFEIKERHFDRAEQLNRLGHDVVLFDARAHGLSGGSHCTFGQREHLDVASVIDHAAQQHLIDADRVLTLGFSMGAATMLQHAAIDPRVAGVVALAPFVDIPTAMHSFRECFTPWMDADWLEDGFDRAAADAGFAFRGPSAGQAVADIQAPVLLVEAGMDNKLPPDSHIKPLREAFLAKAQAGSHDTDQAPQVEVFTVPEAGHYTLCRRDWPGLDDTIAQFFERSAASTQPAATRAGNAGPSSG